MTRLELARAPENARGGRAERGMLRLIKGYQRVREGRLSPCRFFPSCSEYALEAVERHGAWHGGWMAARRISRCRPLGGRGIDLVPIERGARKERRP